MSVDTKYREVLKFLKEPQAHHHSGDKPICYITFDTKQVPYVKRQMEIWKSLAKREGFKNIEVISLAKVINEFFRKDSFRLEYDNIEDIYEIEEVYSNLGENLINNHVIENAILEVQKSLKNKTNPLIFLVDMEAVHPFTRFGPVEQKIYNEIEIPIIIFYPGEKSGSALKFLGFYPEDGNYRSKHF